MLSHHSLLFATLRRVHHVALLVVTLFALVRRQATAHAWDRRRGTADRGSST
jgi:hypothetical protein